MAASLDAAEFHAKVYQIVRQIPPGRVTSYGHIAKLIGMPRHSRHVGQALKFLPAGSDIPWQRVVSSSGAISSRGPGTDGARRQRERLEDEEVEVIPERGNEEMGGGRVNWARYGWFPARAEIDLEDEPGPHEDHADDEAEEMAEEANAPSLFIDGDSDLTDLEDDDDEEGSSFEKLGQKKK